MQVHILSALMLLLLALPQQFVEGCKSSPPPEPRKYFKKLSVHCPHCYTIVLNLAKISQKI